MSLHSVLSKVTARIVERSQQGRQAYLDHLHRARDRGPRRHQLSCSNLAHGFAACGAADKAALIDPAPLNLAIVSAYNDLLSAHQPLGSYPEQIKAAAREKGAVAQFAGGVPAMCDGVTQGQAGMELSLFSRDTIALATAIALSHDLFDGALCLGVCDKIVPGLLIGALSFGHLPVIFIPAGPMPSGLPNAEKARIRQLHAEGKADRRALLEAEAASYHAPGTCTFFGTANSNQMFMEVMGLHLPGASFVNPGTALRTALTRAAVHQLTELVAEGERYTPLGEVVDERAIVNAIVGLLATGGSTNHTLHLVAIARAAGILIDWQDFADLASAVPLIARIYPNGSADVNHFHQAGGLAFLIGALLDAGLLHQDVRTIAGGPTEGLAPYRAQAALDGDTLVWEPAPAESRNPDVLRPVADPFQPHGGLRLLTGNLGRAVIKTSAVAPSRWRLTAPAWVYDSQEAFLTAFQQGQTDRDGVVVVRYQGPRANGMPELHQLMPPLGVLQDRGFKVALLTDGRLSGASGKVPAAIHLHPEAAVGGPLAKLQSGDQIVLDAEQGVLAAQVEPAVWAARTPTIPDLSAHHRGLGRELFAHFRAQVTSAETGAVSLSF